MNVHELFPSNWLSGHDLNGKRIAVTIRTVTLEEMQTPGGGKEQKPVVWFEKATKGLVLNKTNALAIAKQYGPDTETWSGKAVTLYPTTVMAFGEEHNVVRVANGK